MHVHSQIFCSPGCSVVEFRDEEFVKKAIETMNKQDLSGRPLNIKEVRALTTLGVPQAHDPSYMYYYYLVLYIY